MIIVGLDLSLTSTGVALPDGPSVIRSKARGMERLDDIAERTVGEWIRKWDFSDLLVVVEGYSFSSRSSQAHALGEVGGLIRWRMWKEGVAYVDVPPKTLKKYATGKGNAGKEEMLVAAVKRLGYEGASNDEADALWLRTMGCDALGAALVEMPALNRTALAAVAWPERVEGADGR